MDGLTVTPSTTSASELWADAVGTEHPITPPPELVQQWLGDYFGCVVNGEVSDLEKYLATQAARWGADKAIAAALRAAALHCKRDRLILLSLANELEGQ